MTLPRLSAMSEYWKRHPPLHVLVANFIGYKPADESVASKSILEELPEFEP